MPVLAPGVHVERRAALARGTFGWSRVIVCEERGEDVPCSRVVAGLVTLADGERPLAEIAARMAPVEGGAPSPLEPAVLQAAGILYVDGLIESLG